MVKKVFFRVAFIVSISFFLVTTTTRASAALSVAGIINILLKKNCFDYKIVGVCFHHFKPGIKIELWEPVYLVETVKRPFDTNIPGVNVITESLRAALHDISSSGSMETAGQRHLQFNDVHIVSFPFSSLLGLIGSIVPMWCSKPDAPFPTVYYLSELDLLNWRQTADEFTVKSIIAHTLGGLGICDIIGAAKDLSDLAHVSFDIRNLRVLGVNIGDMCMGTWGSVYPRRGWLNNQSEVVGSAGDVYRAVSWASSPLTDIHVPKVVLVSLPYGASTKDRLQQIYPHVTGCIGIGENPARWDYDDVSPNGEYVWVYWKHFVCCK